MDTSRKSSFGFWLHTLTALTTLLIVNLPVMAQNTNMSTGASTLSFKNTLTARSGNGTFELPGFERFWKPENGPIASGGLNSAVGTAGEVPVLRAALDEAGTAPNSPAQTAQPAQAGIEQQAKKLRAGVRGGVALDPELILMGGQIQLGPIFRSNIFFRPSIEFAFGEVTAMFGFNGEFLYMLPSSSAQDRWSPYFGGGLGVNLLHQNFEREEGEQKIDFGDFHSDLALNILGGMQNRNGVFLELRTSVYSEPSPTLRLVVGYNF